MHSSRRNNGGLIWDERSLNREEHPKCANHLCDATLYAWRFCHAYLSVAPVPPPKVGSPEYYRQIEDEMEQFAVESAMEKERLRREAEEWGYM